MKLRLIHDDFRADIEWSEEDGTYVGHVLDVTGSLSFHGDTIPDLQQRFTETIETFRSAVESGFLPKEAQQSHIKAV